MPVSVDVAISCLRNPCECSVHHPCSPPTEKEAEAETETTTRTEAVNLDIPLSPILEFQFFHKAIRTELERLYLDAIAVEKGGEKEFIALYTRYNFLRVVYTQHSNAEDEVSSLLLSSLL